MNVSTRSCAQEEESQRITKVSRIHPLGTMYNVCAKLHGNPSMVVDIFHFGPKWWTN